MYGTMMQTVMQAYYLRDLYVQMFCTYQMFCCDEFSRPALGAAAATGGTFFFLVVLHLPVEKRRKERKKIRSCRRSAVTSLAGLRLGQPLQPLQELPGNRRLLEKI